MSAARSKVTMCSTWAVPTAAPRPSGRTCRPCNGRRGGRWARRVRSSLPCRASEGSAGSGGEAEPPASSSSTTPAQAYQLLGLPHGAPYETVLQAKNRLLER